MRIICIRHLETRWNKDKRLQGSKNINIDSPSKEVLQKIELLKNKIKNIHVELIIASELKRTQETAILYGFETPFIDPLINELDFGEYEGKKKDFFLEKIGENWIKNPLSLSLGESMIDFEKRIKTFLKKYKDYNALLLFGHGAFIRGLVSINEVGTISNMNKFHIENNSIVDLLF